MVTPTSPNSAPNKPSVAPAASPPRPSTTQAAVPFATLLARLGGPSAPAEPFRSRAVPVASARWGRSESARAAHDRVDAAGEQAREDAERDGEDGGRQDSRRRGLKDDDALSSWSRHCADLAPPQLVATFAATRAGETGDAPIARARTSLEELLPGMVKRVAWSGDGKRGAVRMELGSGELAGGVLFVEAEGRAVRVRLDAPAGVSTASWQATIRARLEARGLNVESVDVS